MRRFLGWAILAGLTVLTLQQSQVWTSEEALWTRAVALSPQSPRPHLNLGLVLQRQNDMTGALREFRLARETAGTIDWPANMKQQARLSADTNIALMLLVEGKYQESIALSTAVLNEWPEWRTARLNRGTAYLATGRCWDALTDYMKAKVEELPRCW